MLRIFPRMPATVVAERVGWPYSIRTLSGRVAECARRICRRIRLVGRLMPQVRSPVISGSLISSCRRVGQTRAAKLLPVLTMVCGYSRFALAMLLPSRSAADLYAGWWRLIEQLGAVPEVLVWDGEGAVGGGEPAGSS